MPLTVSFSVLCWWESTTTWSPNFCEYGTVSTLLGRDDARLEGRRDRDDLVDAARVVHLADRRVAAVLRRRRARRPGVVRRGGGQRQHLAGGGVQHDRAAVDGPRLLDLRASTSWAYHCRSLSIVSCTSRPATGSTRLCSPDGITRPPASTSATARPSTPASTRVPAELDAGRALALAVGEARRRWRPARPPGCERRGSESTVMPSSSSSSTRLPTSGVEVAGQVDERGVALEPLDEVAARARRGPGSAPSRSPAACTAPRRPAGRSPRRWRAGWR